MFFLAMRYLIVLSIFESLLIEGYKTQMDRVYTTQKYFYLESYRRNKDYNYKDWESTTADALYDFKTRTTETTITNRTDAALTTGVTSMTTPAQSATETSQKEVMNETTTTLNVTTHTTKATVKEINTTISEMTTSLQENITSTDLPETEALHVTLPSDATLEDILKWFATTSYNASTVELHPPPTVNVEDMNPNTVDNFLDHTVPLVTTTKSPILADIENEINRTNEYFTSSLHELLLVLSHKNSSDIQMLIMSMNDKITNLIKEDNLAVFSPLLIEVFQTVLQTLLLAQPDVTREHLNYAVFAVHNRHSVFHSDINAAFDVVDSIYSDQDLVNIAAIIKKVEEYPNVTEDSYTLVSELLAVFIFGPHTRVLGTAKERLLMMELHNAMQNRLYPGQHLGRKYGENEDRKIAMYWRPFGLQPTTLKVKRTMGKPLKRRQNTKIFTKYTYEKPITKSINKINKKTQNKYNRREKKRSKRKEIENKSAKTSNIDSSLQTLSSSSSESSSTQDSDIFRYSLESTSSYEFKINDRTIPRRFSNKFTTHNKLGKNKTKGMPSRNAYRRNRNSLSKSNMKEKTVLSKIHDKLEEISQDVEEILKLKLKDAMLHSRKDVRRSEKLNKMRTIDSLSDEEVILKSNIYKVFGFSDDFGEQMRTMPVYRRTSF